MQKITVIVNEKSAEVRGVAKHGTITTPTNSFGGPNVTHYDVTLAGHEVAGTWADDARYNTTVRLDDSHPLAAAVLLIAEAQEIHRNLGKMVGKTPTGWRADDWRDAIHDEQRRYHVAKAAVEADATAMALLAGESVEAA